ncbi:hypothetical protein BDQ12DRAFT_686388 [Crucibulum laeve]|uniref:Uncharacterized protein n=1 Tax=Crucibulum laeve TaxID=68775 RepID=A0A5C3LUH2_9AGAR|nr:hypothetical protein BDQ12DRAFT_686388 [Crucibulum laeve]
MYKFAPMVAFYWLLNRLLTYWFMREVSPTLSPRKLMSYMVSAAEWKRRTNPLSPGIMTLSRTRPIVESKRIEGFD